jgi:Holliday junction resolvasome RuvABC ATP-dependent DNA helicase subunit
MYFIGQIPIMNQLSYILPHLKENKDAGMNILMRGPSGWGKTKLSFMVCNFITGGDFEYCLGDKLLFNPEVRVHFIDEVHLLEHPETLYPAMDAGNYIIVMATNDVALIPEALTNRCTVFIFDQYTNPQLRAIADAFVMVKLPDSFMDYIIESGAGNPRIIKSIVSRLNIVLTRNPRIVDGMSLENFKLLLKDTFGIEDGMDVMCKRYIEALENVGGTASIETLSSYIHIDKSTMKFYIEPILLYKNRIKITSKGRSLI